jgi:hypothetical protein
MNPFKFSPLDRGLWVQCRCGAEMLIPPETLRHDQPVYCPCGSLEYVPVESLNALQAQMFKLASSGVRNET